MNPPPRTFERVKAGELDGPVERHTGPRHMSFAQMLTLLLRKRIHSGGLPQVPAAQYWLQSLSGACRARVKLKRSPR